MNIQSQTLLILSITIFLSTVVQIWLTLKIEFMFDLRALPILFLGLVNTIGGLFLVVGVFTVKSSDVLKVVTSIVALIALGIGLVTFL